MQNQDKLNVLADTQSKTLNMIKELSGRLVRLAERIEEQEERSTKILTILSKYVLDQQPSSLPPEDVLELYDYYKKLCHPPSNIITLPHPEPDLSPKKDWRQGDV